MSGEYLICPNKECENDTFYLKRQENDPFWYLECTNCNHKLVFETHKTLKIKILNE